MLGASLFRSKRNPDSHAMSRLRLCRIYMQTHGEVTPTFVFALEISVAERTVTNGSLLGPARSEIQSPAQARRTARTRAAA